MTNNLDPLTEDQKNILEQNTVWVLGSTRSGSTWFTTQLLNHKDTEIWNESNIGAFLNPIYNSSKKEFQRDRKDFFFADRYKKKFWLPFLKNLILCRSFLQFNTLEKMIIVKEPESFAASLLLECLPQSKMIFLLRDGRDVVDSWIDSHRKNSWSNRIPLDAKQRSIKIEEYSNYWRGLTNEVSLAYENHNNNLKFSIKYEDLLTNTLEELKKVYDFLNIEINPDELSKLVEKYEFKNIPSGKKGPGKITRSAKPGTWRENFSKEEQEVMHKIMGETLKKKGYQI